MTNGTVRSLFFASSNEGKVSEIRRLAGARGISVRGLSDLCGDSPLPEVAEVGITYEENALIKGRAYSRWSGEAVLVDDTGLELDEFGGLPGVYTAGFGLKRLISELQQGIRYQSRFVCCMAIVHPSGRSISVRGVCSGLFIPDLHRGAPTVQELPYSSYFVPEGETEALSSIMSCHPDFLSHRVRALQTLLSVV